MVKEVFWVVRNGVAAASSHFLQRGSMFRGQNLLDPLLAGFGKWKHQRLRVIDDQVVASPSVGGVEQLLKVEFHVSVTYAR